MKTTDILGCVSGVSFFLVASIWIPIIGPFISLLSPFPLLYYTTKLGFLQALKLAALSTLVVGIFVKMLGHPQLVIFVIEFSILGIALAEILKRRLGIGKTILLGTLAMLIVGFTFLYSIALSKNMGPSEMILTYLQDHLEASVKVYEERGATQEDISTLKLFGTSFIDAVSKIYPSLMIIGTAFIVWLNIVMAKVLFKIGNLEYPDFGPMDNWQTADTLVWGAIAAGFALLIPSENIQFLAINTLIIIMAVYLFQGLAITLFFINKYHAPLWMRVGIYFLIIIQQLSWVVLSIAGLFDQWIDFRKIHRRMEG